MCQSPLDLLSAELRNSMAPWRYSEKTPAPAPLRDLSSNTKMQKTNKATSTIARCMVHKISSLPKLRSKLQKFPAYWITGPGDCPHPQSPTLSHRAHAVHEEVYDTTALWKVSSAPGCTVPGFISL